MTETLLSSKLNEENYSCIVLNLVTVRWLLVTSSSVTSEMGDRLRAVDDREQAGDRARTLIVHS